MIGSRAAGEVVGTVCVDGLGVCEGNHHAPRERLRLLPQNPATAVPPRPMDHRDPLPAPARGRPRPRPRPPPSRTSRRAASAAPCTRRFDPRRPAAPVPGTAPGERAASSRTCMRPLKMSRSQTRRPRRAAGTMMTPRAPHGRFPQRRRHYSSRTAGARAARSLTCIVGTTLVFVGRASSNSTTTAPGSATASARPITGFPTPSGPE
ncbi:hypothetical protein B0H17DRAFT_40981 [Mycena rosella]|uniref:Uncharacterized protein n=1 Tax=Mycena rosella TaxID=1033263 RepID=A0AAD7M6W3_MYCRO|nr:hypothetical protein B0H17DRAFT_40981 [Mycena rosella]